MSGFAAMGRSGRSAAAAAAAATVVALVVAGQVTGAGQAMAAATAMAAAVAVSFTTTGAVVLAGRPGHPVGRLMIAAGLVAALSAVAASWPGWVVLAWLSQWVWWPPFGLISLALLVFPDGRLPSPRWRPLALLIATASALAAGAFALAAVDHPRTLLTAAAPPSTGRAQLLVWIAVAAIAITMAGIAGVVWSLGHRWRRSDENTRYQLACLLPAAVLVLLAIVLDALGLPGAWVVTVALPLGMTVAVLRYRLYGLDQVVNRTIVWLVMSLLVIVGFVALVSLLRGAILGGSTSTASIAATGVIAVTFEPLRRWVQRGVDRLVYGDRDDPYQVIRRMGDLVGHTVDTHAVLPRLTDAVARSLRLPYVALQLDGHGGPRLLAEHGAATTTVEGFDMVVRGRCIGRLLAATRSPGSRFTPGERRLLGDVAQHTAVAAEASQLIRDLQESRQRLVVAREEERHRLRRDLHDGIGASIAGMSMQVRAARKLLSGPARADRILAALTNDLRNCQVEVRRLVEQLRPPALDRGLSAALHAECQRFHSPALTVVLQVEGNLDGLPAAVEVAAYRIVTEALTNVARHSRARACRVTVRRNRYLTVEIADNGVGMASASHRGVGLRSMRERAVELGGDCEIAAGEPDGTAVQVRLPIIRARQPVDASEVGSAAT